MSHKFSDFSRELSSTILSAGKLIGSTSLFKSKQRPFAGETQGKNTVEHSATDMEDKRGFNAVIQLENSLANGNLTSENDVHCPPKDLVIGEIHKHSAADIGDKRISNAILRPEDLSVNGDNIPCLTQDPEIENTQPEPPCDAGTVTDDSPISQNEVEDTCIATLDSETDMGDLDDTVTPEYITNYEASDDCRSRMIERCKVAVQTGLDALPERSHINEIEAKRSIETRPYLFDIVNCRFSVFSCNGISKRMPIYVCIDDKEPSLCHRHGIYKEALVDGYELFHDARVKTSYLRHHILDRSLDEIIGNAIPEGGCRFMCLMPDVVDDFDQVLRAQLNYKGIPLFQVPRSIALAYTLTVEGWDLPAEFLCLDYDGEDFFAIKICNIQEENGERIFVRMGREKISGKHPSNRDLTNQYLAQYQEKHGITLCENTISNLVNTKLLQHLLFEDAPYLLLDNGGVVTPIYADQDIIQDIAKKVHEDMKHIETEKHMTVYAMCGLFKDPQEMLYNITNLEVGCQEICTRAKQGKILWQEYLPDLKLEVNRDGCFDQIQLIGEEHRRQNINTFVLDENICIPVVDGTVTFPANGAKHYDLPLVREVFGRHSKEKMARFTLEEPLKEAVQVELSVRYQYGDIDSYRLIAYSKDYDRTIQSTWYDAESLTLRNPAPSFSEVNIEKRVMSKEEIDGIEADFHLVCSKVKDVSRPQKLRYGSVYAIPKNSKRFYSKYLFELNKGGMPFFGIQNFFKKESFSETRSNIAKLLSTGVFSDISKILQGELPVNHSLGVDEPTGQREDVVLIRNMADISSNFGIFYALKDGSEDSNKVYNAIEGVLLYFKNQKHPKIQYWAPMTKYVRRSKDHHEIWNYFSNSLSQLNPQKPRSTIYDLRAISGVCFQTETWINDFFDDANGRQNVEWIIENIIAILYDRDCLSERNPTDKYNPRKIRDVLELLLCICRLKEKDPTILDCNEQRTKLLVKQLKKIDADMRTMKENNLLKCPFNSRLGITAPDAYCRVNPVIYALIETLTGGNQVSLIGFSDEDEAD